MDASNLVFAYFGPETVLPMTSVVATIVGLIMMFGRHSLRVLVGTGRFIIKSAGRMIRPSSHLYQGPHSSLAGQHRPWSDASTAANRESNETGSA
jgi:hypothetical protein